MVEEHSFISRNPPYCHPTAPPVLLAQFVTAGHLVKYPNSIIWNNFGFQAVAQEVCKGLLRVTREKLEWQVTKEGWLMPSSLTPWRKLRLLPWIEAKEEMLKGTKGLVYLNPSFGISTNISSKTKFFLIGCQPSVCSSHLPSRWQDLIARMAGSTVKVARGRRVIPLPQSGPCG